MNDAVNVLIWGIWGRPMIGAAPSLIWDGKEGRSESRPNVAISSLPLTTRMSCS
jgi:hypothetical protein